MRSCARSLLKVQTGRAMSQMIVAFAALLAAIAPVAAQDWPNRPVTMLVPFAAAGGGRPIGIADLWLEAAREHRKLGRPWHRDAGGASA